MNPKITKAAVSNEIYFDPDIKGMFQPFRAAMMWRFDLTNYDDVVQNYELILGRISSKDSPMPPPPLTPLTEEQIEKFRSWGNNFFPFRK